MSAKDIILDFLNYTFILILVAFFILYFIIADRFIIFSQILQSLMPLAVFSIFFLIKVKLDRKELKKRKYEENEKILLYLTYADKFKSDLLIFSLPIIILLIPSLIYNKIDWIDISQASVVLLIMLTWQKIIFAKK